MKIMENFYGENLYTFTNYACSCNEDVVFEKPDAEPRRTFKLYSDVKKPIKFAYAAKKGLIRLAKNGTIETENILGIFIGLEKASRKKLEQFLSDNGFLFPISEGRFEAIDVQAFMEIVQRLRMTVDLMTELGSANKDYNRMAELALQLTFANPFEMKTEKMETAYVSCHHSFADLIERAEQFQVDSQRKREALEYDVYMVEDTISDGVYQMNVDEYNDITGNYTNYSDILKAVVQLFVNYNGTETERAVIDFLFHWLYVPVKENSEPDSNDKMKTNVQIFAKWIVGEEINHNLSGIRPVYNSENMEPSWKVDSLMSALYFSLFYLKPNMELYRPCSNPRCSNYFLVKSTSSKTKYCCTKCSNNVTQTRYRKKKQENK